MVRTERGYQPKPGWLTQQVQQIPELQHASMPEFCVIESPELLDSSDMTPQDWNGIADMLHRHADSFDGFVVVHGTDTMTYATSALSFMLENLDQPIVFTGSQLPLGERRNDARENLVTAMILAGEYPIHEVALLFGDKLLRGNRATKMSSDSFQAFDSPNFPPLGTIGTRIHVRRDLLAAGSREPLTINPIQPQPIATFRLFPGVSAKVLENLLDHPLKALILETYGVGNGPSDRGFMKVISKATENGIIIINCSQCAHGCIAMDHYAAGKALADCGVISGRDMTIEAALTKTMHLFSHYRDREFIAAQLQGNLAGELTPAPAGKQST